MNPTAIYSKSGKGVQEASGKTSLLNRVDRAVLSAIDGRLTLADVAQKVGKPFDIGFQDLISKLDKDGFVREVSPGVAAKAPAGKSAAKPAAKPVSEDSGGDLDFSTLGGPKAAPPPPPPRAAPPPRPAAPPPPRPAPPPPPPPKPAAPRPDPLAESQAKAQHSALQRAREEAEEKAAAERERVKAEAEAKLRTEMEAKARSDAEKKAKEEAEAQIRAAAARAAAEAKAKADAEAKAKLEAERKAREEAERARKEAEEVARKAREEAERARKAAEEEARRVKEEAERARKKAEEEARKAREEAERARKEAERARKEAEEAARKVREDAERKREEAERAERRKREEEEEKASKRRQREEAEEAERREEEKRASKRRQREEEELQAQEAAAAKAAAKRKLEEEVPVTAKSAASGIDSLMADLDSFTTREESDRKEKEEAERKAKEESDRRAREEAERRAREEAEHQKKEEARARKEEEKQRKREEDEQLAKKREKEEKRLREEEERRKREADERERKAKADEVLAAKATRGPEVAVGEDTGEVRKRMLGRRGAGVGPASVVEPPMLRRKKSGLGKSVAITLVVLLIAAVGALHVMPVSTADYERAASEALGAPVKIGEASFSLLSGELQIKLKNIRLGDEVRIASGAASPELSSLRSEKKKFTSIELDGVQFPQEAIGQALLAKVLSDNFAVNRVVVRKLELTGAAVLPAPLEVDLVYGIDGTMTQATVRGPDTLFGKISPTAKAIEYDITAHGFPLPVLPGVTLSDFRMRGTASQRGMQIAEWGGKLFGGGISGTANIRWSGGWSMDGVVTARNINAAVFAPALLSEGRGEGTGRFSMSGADPSKLGLGGRLDGNFTISSGVLGSFDLGRVLRTSGKEYAGRTQFTELAGQATYDRGVVSLRNVTISAGALNAGASADIAQSGALSGRIVADVKSGSGRALSATMQLGGTIREPQVKN